MTRQRLIIHGIELPERRIQEITDRANARLDRTKTPKAPTKRTFRASLKRDGPGLLGVVALMVVIYFAMQGWERLQARVPALDFPLAGFLAFVAVLVIAAVAFVGILLLLARRRLRPFMSAFRHECRIDGIEVCMTCGFHLGQMPDDAKTCAHCGAVREPLRETASAQDMSPDPE